MKEQPQKPEIKLNLVGNATADYNVANNNRLYWIDWAVHLEQENTALKAKVAELLERAQRDEPITNAYIRDSIRASRARQLCQQILDWERPCPSAMQLARDVITWLDGADNVSK